MRPLPKKVYERSEVERLRVEVNKLFKRGENGTNP